MDSRTTWPALIGALIKGEALTADEAEWAMNEIMDGAATPVQIAGFGVALRIKGETVAELSGLAEAMLYVDEDNVPAIKMYEGLGFTRWSTDAMYRQRALDVVDA